MKQMVKPRPDFRGMPVAQGLKAHLQRLQTLYDTLPTMLCQGLCQDSCGPIAFHPIETDLLRSRGIPLPVIASGDASMTCSALSAADGLC